MDTPPTPTDPTNPLPATRPRRPWWYRGVYAARLTLGLGLLLIWTGAGLPGAWQTWWAAAHTPSAAAVSYDAQRLTLEANTLYTLFMAARQACPPAQPVLALSDDVRALQQGNYLLYPRRIDLVRQADPFGAANIAAHAGGCVFYYGPVGGRLDPFRAQLSEITCDRDGCLYRVVNSEQ